MKILYFTQGFTPHDRRFLEALATSEHEINYMPLLTVSSRNVSASIPDAIAGHGALLDSNVLTWRRYPDAVTRFRERLEQIQPDLVHAGPIHLSATISALAGFHPLVSMSWGSDLLFETRKLWVNVLARYTLRRSDAFVGDCQAVKKAASRLGMDEDRIVLFPWGTDLDHFSPGPSTVLRQKLGWEEAFVLLSTRSFESLYDVDLIVKAFIRVSRKYPELRLLLLGDGSQREILKKSLTDGGLSENVHFAGLVSRDQLPEFYRSADLYLSASHSDGSSVSLLEAMACGLPAIVSDIPGNREWVKPGVNGWWFRSGELGSLVDRIDEAFQSDQLPALGSAAREIVEKRADWSQNFPRLLEAYELASCHHASKQP